MKLITLKIFAVFVIAVFLQSCSSIKAYQKNYLNDSEMQLTDRKVQKTESNFLLYREGDSGANGGKNGGGCGCN
jgi:hypothetical protein